MIKRLLMLLLTGSGSAFAASPNYSDFIFSAPCEKEVRSKVDAKLARQTWVPQAVAEPHQSLEAGIAFRDTRTQKAYKIWKEKKVTYFAMDDLKTHQEIMTAYDTDKLCKPTVSERPTHSLTPEGVTGFTDDSLNSLLKGNKWGVIYVWTPYMPLSVTGLKEIKAAVKAKGGSLTILMDPKADVREAQKWVDKGDVKSEEMTKVASDEINARGLGVHYPIAYIYKDGFLSNRPYIGNKPEAIYEKWQTLELAEMTKDMK